MPSRRATQWINALAATFAIGASTSAVLLGGAPAPAAAPLTPVASAADVDPIVLPGGGRAITDATGVPMPLIPRHRIASGSSLADPVLLALAAPADVVAFSARAPKTRDA